MGSQDSPKFLSGINVEGLLADTPLTPHLEVSQMAVTQILKLKTAALFDIINELYKAYCGGVRPRLAENGIVFDAGFSGHSGGMVTSAPIAMLVESKRIGPRHFDDIPSLHYLRFNTEECMDSCISDRDYSGLTELISPFIEDYQNPIRQHLRENMIILDPTLIDYFTLNNYLLV